mgnify:FL=1
MAEVVRAIDTPRGPLVVTVQRVAERCAMRELTPEDLLKAAPLLFHEAAWLSKQSRRPEPEAATVGVVEEGA